MPRKRYLTIDIAKSIAILLVVIGHYHPDTSPGWYDMLHDVIYTFHMPLFMMASGFLYIAGRRPELTYGAFVYRKFRRLMIPYFSASVLIILFKLASQSVLQVDNPVTPLDFVRIFYSPAAGFFLWFIWSLWWIFLIVGLVRSRRGILALAAVSVILCYMPWEMPEIFCLRQTARMMVYFMAGVLLYDCRRYVAPLLTHRAGLTVTILFAVGTIVVTVCGMARELSFLLPYLGSAAVLYVSWALERATESRLTGALLALAPFTYIIYLFHTTFMGLAKGLCGRLLPVIAAESPVVFIAVATLVIAAGVVLPVLADICFIRRWRLTRTLFGQ